MHNKVTQFIQNNHLGNDSVDISVLTTSFVSKMNEAIRVKSKSMMINSYICTDFEIKENERIIVIDAGGTNLRTCSVYFDSNLQPVIEDFSKSTMPGVEKEVSSEEFFSCIADNVERLIDKSDKIGWCFSYPATILENRDGVPILMSKEIKAPEIIGKQIGKELLNELESRGHNVSEKKVIVMNDTVTTLLAALASAKTMNCSSCIGFILGTGTNTALEKDGIVYNVESGQFDYICSDIERKMIEETKNPSIQHLEKQISGAYIGNMASRYAGLALQEGLISNFPDNMLSTPEISFFLAKQPSVLDSLSQEDRETLEIIFNAVIERSAKLAAANLAAAVIVSGKGKDHPVLINADGSTYYKTKGYGQEIERNLTEYLNTLGLSVRFIHIEDSPIIGSALGAMAV